MSSSKVKRTYSSRQNRPAPPSSPPSDLAPSSPAAPRQRALFAFDDARDGSPPPKRRALTKPLRVLPIPAARGAKPAGKKARAAAPARKALTQLHFALDTSTLRTCALCALSYTHGAPDDEALHRAHCARVQRGMEWGREEERAGGRVTVDEVRHDVRLNDGRVGRIVCFRTDVAGKIGSKFRTLLDTVNVALSSPPLTADVLKASKAYVFLLRSATPASRERIVGCVIAQRIESAMAVATSEQIAEEQAARTRARSPSALSDGPGPRALIPIHIDPTTSLYVHPAPLPTALGIPRLFVSSAHRRQGIAHHLLTAAAATFVHGCPLDPARGDVAFTQPTNLGRAVMDRWGKGGVRIYEE